VLAITPTGCTARIPLTQSVPARAYGGSAHRLCWFVLAEQDAPSEIDLGLDGQAELYRLVHHPRTGRPARDHLGNLVYMPLPLRHPPAARAFQPVPVTLDEPGFTLALLKSRPANSHRTNTHRRQPLREAMVGTRHTT